MLDVVRHPQFAVNRWIYFSYSKPGDGRTPMVLARGRYEGASLTDVRDLYESDPTSQGGSRLAFAPDGSIYMTISGALGRLPAAAGASEADPRKLDTAYGKVVRLRDDGSVPPDNPFVGRAGARPEIYSIGHRDHFGIAPHPVTGQMFHVELGPYGGDKVNVLKAGGDYGWRTTATAEITTVHHWRIRMCLVLSQPCSSGFLASPPRDCCSTQATDFLPGEAT
jgi:glucose/arabinose dehydrogenase